MKIIQFVLAYLTVFTVTSNCDENPGFFLKISKNVPRIGRRSGNSDFDNFFLKSSKSVPRIGRRSQYVENNIPEETTLSWYDRLLRPSKRSVPNSVNNYNNIQPFDMKFLFDLLSADESYDGSDLKFISWKDFDEAIETDTELFRKLMTLSKERQAEEWASHFNPNQLTKLVSMPDNNGNGLGAMYYRTDRSFDNNFVKVTSNDAGSGLKNGKTGLNKEKPDFQF